jgi:hypothetical protein
MTPILWAVSLHKCKHCGDATGDAFGEAGTLSKHIETVHETRRDHKCPHCAVWCGDAFGHASTLTKHEARTSRACTKTRRTNFGADALPLAQLFVDRVRCFPRQWGNFTPGCRNNKRVVDFAPEPRYIIR